MSLFRLSKRQIISGAALISLSALLTSCGSTNGSKASTSGGTELQKGMAFYKGKTITFIAPDSPGGGFDQYARDYEPILSSYLHANITVLNVPAGNTVAGQNQVAKAKPDGLTVGWLNAGPDIEDAVLGIPGLLFNPSTQALLGGTAPNQDVIAVSTSAACKQWTSWAEVVRSSTVANPVSEVIQTTGTTTFVLVLANGVFGVHARTIPGYSSSSALLQGFQRGDGCVVIDPVSTIGPLVKGGQARPLLTNVALQKSNAYWQYFKSTPTIAQAEQQFAKSITTILQKTGVNALNGAATSARKRVQGGKQ